jgi:hypothetical protein
MGTEAEFSCNPPMMKKAKRLVRELRIVSRSSINLILFVPLSPKQQGTPKRQIFNESDEDEFQS